MGISTGMYFKARMLAVTPDPAGEQREHGGDARPVILHTTP